MRSLAYFTIAIALTACTATLRDGTYGCPDGNCPPGMTCGMDHICRFSMGAPDMGLATDTGPSQCGPPCNMGAMCFMGRVPPGAGAMWTCVQTPNPPLHGMHCSIPANCSGNDGCFPGPAPPSTSACMRPCQVIPGVDTCGFGEQCVMGMGGGGGAACLLPCPTGGCPGEFACMGGHCVPPGW